MTTPSEQMSYYGESDYDNISFNDNISYDYENVSNDYGDMVEMCEIGLADHLYHNLSLYVYSIVIVLGLLGNLLVIVTYALNKKTRSLTDVYLLNVAVTDMLFVLVLPFIIYNEQHNWVMGDGACKFLSGAYSFNLYSGILLLGCISGDRYLTIVWSKSSHMIVYSRFICAVVWVVAFLMSIPTFIYSGLYPNIPESQLSDFPSTGSESEKYQREPTLTMSTAPIPSLWSNLSEYTDYDYSNITDYAEPWEQEAPPRECMFIWSAEFSKRSILIPGLQMAVGFLLPLVWMTFSYTAIIITLVKARNIERHKPKEWLVLTVLLVFIICHLPYSITLLVYTITLGEEMECSSAITMLVGLHITRTLAYLHCCLNPILYALSGLCFHRQFHLPLRDLWRVGRSYMPAQQSSSHLTSEV